eukprot:TRINITY_DN1035_c0_g1_i1.p1 TRINITY_DN1035_c0_g1~~TRINITY_DN1035_c0_g1_i1.p1  ORF type:complete len:328 (-),score=51.82 TRINITY_DN1035_c0_g1_i1:446-1429(-)
MYARFGAYGSRHSTIKTILSFPGPNFLGSCSFQTQAARHKEVRCISFFKLFRLEPSSADSAGLSFRSLAFWQTFWTELCTVHHTFRKHFAMVQRSVKVAVGASVLAVLYFQFASYRLSDEAYVQLIDYISSHRAEADVSRRTELLRDLRSGWSVVEPGAGTAANLALFPPGVELDYIAAEPKAPFHPHIDAALANHTNIRGRVTDWKIEHLQIEDNSVDAVIVTHVLCSVDDQAAALREVYRVLKPNGKLYFLEHVAADSQTGTRTLQHWLRGALMQLLGCDPERETVRPIVEVFGMDNVQFEWFQSEIPLAVFRPHIAGFATKSSV